MEMTRDEVNELFTANQILRVTFIKKDGTERVMKCTRSLGMIPTEFHPKGGERKQSEDIFPVFDLSIQGWRSFRLDSIISIEVG
jgi:hypothetical protein